MKTLYDTCLMCIANNLDRINRVGSYLAPVHKELLIERLAWHDMLTQAYLPHVTYNLFSSALKRVNFYHCKQVTDTVLKQLGASGCKLQKITIHACSSVTDAGILAVTQGQDELQSIELRKLSSLTNSGLQNIQSETLEKIDLRQCSSLTIAGIRPLINKNPSIKELTLALCSKLEDTVITLIARVLSGNLEHLDVEGIQPLSNASLEALATHCTNLTSLNICGSNQVTADGFSKIFQSCSKLEKLDLSYCEELKNSRSRDCLMLLPCNLRELSLCGILLRDEQLLVDTLHRLTMLRKVRFCGVPGLNDTVMGEILSVLGPNLEELDLSGGVMVSLTDISLHAVATHCTKLKVLLLSLLKDVTGLTLLPMFTNSDRAVNFTGLLLGCFKLNAAVLPAVISNCCNLEKLSLAGLQTMDDNLLIDLANNCPKLTDINLKACTRVTDKAICQLARCCPLTIAVLSGLTLLTDKSIFALANSCPYLQEIYLNGCSLVTPAAVRYLQDCCIERVYCQHRVPNVDPMQIMALNLDTGEFCRVLT